MSNKLPEMKMEIMSLKSIKPYWRNPRKNDNAVDSVKKSINRYGFLQPIVVDSNNVIIVGHTRFRGLMQLGYEKCPVVIADHLNEQLAKEYRIADNSISDIAEFDVEALVQEMREIKDIEQMEDYFQNLDVEKLLSDSVAVTSYKEITKDKVDKQTTDLENQFKEMAKEFNSDFVSVTCPHCAEDFSIKKSEIQ